MAPLAVLGILLTGSPSRIEPFFTVNSNAPYDRIYSVLKSDERTMDSLTDLLFVELSKNENRHRDGQTVEQIAKTLKTVADRVVAQGSSDGSQPLRQWMYAEAISGWIRMNMRYDREMLKSQQRYELNQSYSVLSRLPATATCGGFARVGLMLARQLNIEAWHLGGSNRGWGLIQTNKDTHGWNLFKIGDMLIPADSCVDIDVAEPWKVRGKTKEWECLPRRREAWELFLARHYNTYWIDVPSDEKGCEQSPYSTDPLTKMSFETWGQKDTNYMLDLQRFMERLESERHRRVIR